MRIDNRSINRQCILSSSLKIATSSSKPIPQGDLGTRFHDIKGIIVWGFYHAREKEVAFEIYERSNHFHSAPLGLTAFVEV